MDGDSIRNKILSHLSKRDEEGLKAELQGLKGDDRKVEVADWLEVFKSAHDIAASATKESCLKLLAAHLETVAKLDLLFKTITDGEEFPITRQSVYAVASDLLSRFPDLLHAKRNGLTVFHQAVKSEAHSLVRELLEKLKSKVSQDHLKTAVQLGNKQEKSALALAVEGNCIEIVQSFLETIQSLEVTYDLLKYVVDKKWEQLASVFVVERPLSINQRIIRHAIENNRGNFIGVLVGNRVDLLQRSQLLHQAVRRGELAVVKHLLDICPDLAIEEDNKGFSALRYNTSSSKGDRDRIRKMILPLIVRRKEPQDIRKLLADKGGEWREICLDLGHLYRSGEQLISSLGHFKTPPGAANSSVDFESTLRYVDIPVPETRSLTQGQSRPPARTEAKEILYWLKDMKKVEGIYHLRVRDSRSFPHTEDTIVDSIQHFNIEVLDWRRLELPYESILDKCLNVKTLRLYAGGWSSTSQWISEGAFWKFNDHPKLETVEVIILKDLIGEAQASEYLSKAEAEVKTFPKLFRVRTVNITQKSGFSGRPSLRPRAIRSRMVRYSFQTAYWRDPVKKNGDESLRTLDTAAKVTKLTSFITAYKGLQIEFKNDGWRELRRLRNRIQPNVKIAVIDNGVDPRSISCSRVTGASFVYPDGSESSWWLPEDSHGTKMARIITELDPFCELFVAKVVNLSKDFTIERVIEAIDWATNAGVDIISMSGILFTDVDNLRAAVKRAVSKNIVIICSTAGEGYNRLTAYPSQYEQVLSIASTNQQGKESVESVVEEAKYAFQGEKIVVRTPSLGTDGSDEMSGTSVATAIAAGVSSLILASHRLALSCATDNESIEASQDNHFIVTEVLKHMMDKATSNYVKPWKFFPEESTVHKYGDAQDVLNWLYIRLIRGRITTQPQRVQ